MVDPRHPSVRRPFLQGWESYPCDLKLLPFLQSVLFFVCKVIQILDTLVK